MKVHFDPYSCSSDSDDSAPDLAPCGTIPPCDDYLATSDWDRVTCKRCLCKKDKLQSAFDESEKIIIMQMRSFVEFARGENDRR